MRSVIYDTFHRVSRTALQISETRYDGRIGFWCGAARTSNTHNGGRSRCCDRGEKRQDCQCARLNRPGLGRVCFGPDSIFYRKLP